MRALFRGQDAERAPDDEAQRLTRRLEEFRGFVGLAFEIIAETLRGEISSTMGDFGYADTCMQTQRMRKASLEFLCSFIEPEGPLAKAYGDAARRSNGLSCATCTIPIVVFLDELQSFGEHKLDSQSSFLSALRDKIIATVRFMDRECESRWNCELTPAGCAALSKQLKTPLSPGEVYRPYQHFTMDQSEAFRELWARLEALKDCVRPTSSLRRKRFESGPAVPPCSSKHSSSGSTENPCYSSFRVKPRRWISSATKVVIPDARALINDIATMNSKWNDFEPTLRGHCATTKADLSAAIMQSPAGFDGLIPWPERLLQAISATLAVGNQAANLQTEINVFLRTCQRRWHPDRFQALAARTFDSDSVETEQLLARVTRVAQQIASLRDSM